MYRYNPTLAEEGKNPFTLDSKEPTAEVIDFLKGETRYAALAKQFPDIADGLFEKAADEARGRLAAYKKMAE